MLILNLFKKTSFLHTIITKMLLPAYEFKASTENCLTTIICFDFMFLFYIVKIYLSDLMCLAFATTFALFLLIIFYFIL